MNIETIIFALVGLVCGFSFGYGIAAGQSRSRPTLTGDDPGKTGDTDAG